LLLLCVPMCAVRKFASFLSPSISFSSLLSNHTP
jgi:hypothetical protein